MAHVAGAVAVGDEEELEWFLDQLVKDYDLKHKTAMYFPRRIRFYSYGRWGAGGARQGSRDSAEGDDDGIMRRPPS